MIVEIQDFQDSRVSYLEDWKEGAIFEDWC